jgi:formate hydrogenlyase subunit 6/NADH:ubiquinone oxidoreductase subunit I
MSILSMMWKNWLGGSRTLLFPKRPEAAERFRGLVRFDPALCNGCAQCKFRCTARAIEFKAGKGEFTWSYEPGQCTFCGRCVEGCKTHALSQESVPPPIYETPGELKVSYTVARKAPAAKAAPKAAPEADSGQTPTPAQGGAQ